MNKRQLIIKMGGVISKVHIKRYHIGLDFEEHPNIKLTPLRQTDYPVTICISDAPGPPYGHFTVVIDTNASGFHAIEEVKMDENGYAFQR